MNYIGSKNKLSSFLKDAICSVAGTDLHKKVFCDMFAGTGIVGRVFKKEVRTVISNDIEYYSYVLNKNYIENHEAFEYLPFFETLNNLPCRDDGFIYNNYCAGSGSGRMYFSDDNGRKIDAMRMQIQQWFDEKTIDARLYYMLLASLLESADKSANTASVYGAFLKNLKASAAKEMILEPAVFEINGNSHQVYNEDSNVLIKKIEGDILYLDPPYNERQYGANYHILNTIAQYDTFAPSGKTGLRRYTRSQYCRKQDVTGSFEDLIKNARFSHIFLSYNNEGLMREDAIKTIMLKYGRYDLVKKTYQRFRADKTENRNHKADTTCEYLHILEKRI